MGERGETERKRLEVFKEEFKIGLEGIIELAEIVQEPIPIDPLTMGMGERNYEELDPEEKNIAKQIILSELGLEEEKLEEFILREYSTTAPEDATAPGEIKASVFETNKDEVFLQRLTFTDKQECWAVGPNQNI